MTTRTVNFNANEEVQSYYLEAAIEEAVSEWIQDDLTEYVEEVEDDEGNTHLLNHPDVEGYEVHSISVSVGISYVSIQVEGELEYRIPDLVLHLRVRVPNDGSTPEDKGREVADTTARALDLLPGAVEVIATEEVY